MAGPLLAARGGPGPRSTASQRRCSVPFPVQRRSGPFGSIRTDVRAPAAARPQVRHDGQSDRRSRRRADVTRGPEAKIAAVAGPPPV